MVLISRAVLYYEYSTVRAVANKACAQRGSAPRPERLPRSGGAGMGAGASWCQQHDCGRGQ